MFPAIFGGSGPMSLPYSFGSRCQLKYWLRVQGVSPKLCFGQQVLHCSTRFQQHCLWVFRIFFFLMRRVAPLLFLQPAKVCIFSCIWEVDALSSEVGFVLFLLSGFSEAIGIPGLRCDAAEELVTIKEKYSSVLVATWTQLFFYLLCFIDHFFLVFWFSSAAMLEISSVFPILSLLLLLHLEFLMLKASEWICEQDCNES